MWSLSKMKTLILSVTALMAASAFAPATAQTAAPASQPPEHHMRVMQPVARAAFLQKVQKHFARLDANHDGFVTQDEFEASAQAMRARMTQAMAQHAGKMFDRMDANHDGVITQAEFNAAIASRTQGGQSRGHVPSWDRLAARLDSNHDGQISRAEFDAARAQHEQQMADSGKGQMHRAGFAAQMFAKADLNHDGRVSLQEATQAAQQWFDAADANHDGTLSPDEMRAMHKAMRPAGQHS
jgi:Ca2+-binding EF-hand superfamily protein